MITKSTCNNTNGETNFVILFLLFETLTSFTVFVFLDMNDF